MSISFNDDTDEVMSEINMTPLVDVMLVLLIIFIITAPVMKHAVNIQLPRASQQRLQAPPRPVSLSVDAQGHYFVQQQPVELGALEAQLRALLAPGVPTGADDASPPQLQIRGDQAAAYAHVAKAMAAAQRAGWRNIAFVTDSEPDRAP